MLGSFCFGEIDGWGGLRFTHTILHAGRGARGGSVLCPLAFHVSLGVAKHDRERGRGVSAYHTTVGIVRITYSSDYYIYAVFSCRLEPNVADTVTWLLTQEVGVSEAKISKIYAKTQLTVHRTWRA